jgi:hypothetical protein
MHATLAPSAHRLYMYKIIHELYMYNSMSYTYIVLLYTGVKLLC